MSFVSGGTITAAGVVVLAVLRPHPSFARPLLAAGKKLPSRTLRLMVDTGADTTCIFEDQVSGVPLCQPIRKVNLVGAAGSEPRPVYPLELVFSGKTAQGRSALKTFHAGMISARRHSSDYDGLLGRDFLQFARLAYDGPSRTFTMEIS